MILKIFTFILFILVLALSFFYISPLLSQEEINFNTEKEISDSVIRINYDKTPVFLDNLRFSKREISFFIEDSCSGKRENSMREAFKIFQNKIEIISFYESDSRIESNIIVTCSERDIEVGESLFAAGEGGPSKIINTSQFKIIQKGKISLFKDQQCDTPIVEIHEIGHVLGFDHSTNPLNIMYNTSMCDQEISEDMVNVLQELYSIDSLPDASIEELSAVKRSGRIDFNITVTNNGLEKIENISLTVSSNSKEIEKIYLGEIGIGYGRTLTATNIKLPSRNIESVDFIIDIENGVKEINEENNLIRMRVNSEN